MTTTTDKKIVEELKAKSASAANGNGKRTSSKESAKAGANRIVEFIDHASTKAAPQIADAITAASIQKAMQLLGEGDGPLTQAAFDSFDAAFTEVLVDLPGLTGADGGAKYFLTSASDVTEERSFN